MDRLVRSDETLAQPTRARLFSLHRADGLHPARSQPAACLIKLRSELAMQARAALLAYWREYGQAHFCSEEELLLPAYAQHADPQDPLVARVLSDHAAIRQRIADMDCDSTPTIEALHELGCLIAAHVRLQERKLFPLIENAFHRPNSLSWLPSLTDEITTRDGLRKLDERLVDPPTPGTVRWWHERRSTTLPA